MPEATSAALDALYLAVRLSLPALLAAYAAASLVGLLQSLTKLGEPVLNAIPRALVVAVTLALSATWLSHELWGFTRRVLVALPELAG